MINIALATGEFEMVVSAEVFYLAITNTKNETIKPFDWENILANSFHNCLTKLKVGVEADQDLMPTFRNYSIFIHLLVGQLPKSVITGLEGDEASDFVQNRLPFIHEGEGIACKIKCYSEFLPAMHLALIGRMPQRMFSPLSDFMSKNMVGELFLCEVFTYVRVHGAKLPPKALPRYAPISLLCLEVIRQMIDEVKIKAIKKGDKPFYLVPPCRFRHFIYNSWQSMERL